jgi:hypothetical protein
MVANPLGRLPMKSSGPSLNMTKQWRRFDCHEQAKIWQPGRSDYASLSLCPAYAASGEDECRESPLRLPTVTFRILAGWLDIALRRDALRMRLYGVRTQRNGRELLGLCLLLSSSRSRVISRDSRTQLRRRHVFERPKCRTHLLDLLGRHTAFREMLAPIPNHSPRPAYHR